MSSITLSPGLSPQLRREVALRDRAMSGDLVFSSPETMTLAASATPYTGDLVRVLELRTASGAVHGWFNADLSASLATSGVAASLPATASFHNGVANLTLSLASATPVHGSHATVSVWGTVMGYDLATASVAFTWASNA